MLTTARSPLVLILLVIVSTLPAADARAQAKKKQRPGAAQAGARSDADLSALSLEVRALTTLAALDLTPDQLEQFTKAAAEVPAEERSRRKGAGSERFQKALTALRSALLAQDEDRIDAASDKLTEIAEAESPKLDDEITASAATHAKAAALASILTFRQVGDYIAGLDDDVRDPVENLLSAFDDIREASESDWRALRDQVADDVGWMLRGPTSGPRSSVRSDAAKLLERVRTLSADEYRTARPELEAAARQLAQGVGPTDVIRHLLEHDFAELLANPRLPAALAALKKKTP